MPLVVLALGGHALDEDRAALDRAAEHIVRLVERGWSVVLTHGNGPQVGELLEAEQAAPEPRPLHLLVAQTQNEIGEHLRISLAARLARSSLKIPPPLVMRMHVEVSLDDAEFRRPSKPVGRWLPEEESVRIRGEGYQVTFRDRSCRRLVPSPEPLRALELPNLAAVLKAGTPTIITCGGGGIPVECRGGSSLDSDLQGVDAVIDKDKASAMLAHHLGADLLVIATSTDGLYVGFGTESSTHVPQIGVEELRGLHKQGEFPEGSMGPKVEACLRFVEGDRQRRSVICSFGEILDAVFGQTGSQIVAGGDRADSVWRRVP